MKNFVLFALLFAGSLTTSCDVQSGITKKSVEKYAPTPAPDKTVEVVEQIDPNDVITVDTALDGPKLLVNRDADRTTVNCNKYNRVAVNVDAKEITIKGTCKQLMINGDRNQVVVVAVSEIVLNGGENDIRYSKYANGKKPLVTDSGSGNTITKTATVETKK